MSELQNTYDAKDWKNYTVYSHGLKSTARLVGAEKLSGLAEQMEHAADREEIGTIEAGHGKMMSLYLQIVGAVKEIFQL